MSTRHEDRPAGNPGYLPRGGACVSCRRRKMVQLHFTFFKNASSLLILIFHRDVMEINPSVVNAIVLEGLKTANTQLVKNDQKFRF